MVVTSLDFNRMFFLLYRNFGGHINEFIWLSSDGVVLGASARFIDIFNVDHPSSCV
jgi:hypothetical protein